MYLPTIWGFQIIFSMLCKIGAISYSTQVRDRLGHFPHCEWWQQPHSAVWKPVWDHWLSFHPQYILVTHLHLWYFCLLFFNIWFLSFLLMSPTIYSTQLGIQKYGSTICFLFIAWPFLCMSFKLFWEKLYSHYLAALNYKTD